MGWQDAVKPQLVVNPLAEHQQAVDRARQDLEAATARRAQKDAELATLRTAHTGALKERGRGKPADPTRILGQILLAEEELAALDGEIRKCQEAAEAAHARYAAASREEADRQELVKIERARASRKRAAERVDRAAKELNAAEQEFGRALFHEQVLTEQHWQRTKGKGR